MSSIFPLDTGGARPGYRPPQRGHIRVTLYARNSDTLVFEGDSLLLNGRNALDTSPTVVSAQIQHSMGQPSAFQLTVKMPPGQSVIDLCTDDDWIDIEIGDEANYWHVLRGLVDEVRESISVAGAGVTVRNCLITGQSFQKIWAQTPMWFSSLFSEQLSLSSNAGSTQDLALTGIGRSVPGTIASFLYTYTNRVAQQGRSSISVPPAMPNAYGTFAQSWRQDATDFDDSDAPRQNILVNSFSPAQTVWDVATQWSDPFFCEMFTAQLPSVSARPAQWTSEGDAYPQQVAGQSSVAALGGSYERVFDGLSILQSSMTLVTRNKPFINIDPENSSELGFESPWFSLPTLTVLPQDVYSIDIGKTGFERVNAFFTSSQVISAIGAPTVDAKMIPSWSIPDMRVHGMRCMDVVSNYIWRSVPGAPALDDTSNAIRLRARVRDYCMANGIYLNGSIGFSRSYPQAQVGTRLFIRGNRQEDNLTGYIETVTHSFSAMGWKTGLGITRGYRGTDKSHLKDLQRIFSTYTTPVF